MLQPRTRWLARESKRLSTDAEIERLAREQYGLVKPGEQPVRASCPRRTTTAPPTTAAAACRPLRRLPGGVAAAAADVAALTELLGRAPQADFEVVVRDADGAPVVIRNAPFTARRHADADPLLARRSRR